MKLIYIELDPKVIFYTYFIFKSETFAIVKFPTFFTINNSKIEKI